MKNEADIPGFVRDLGRYLAEEKIEADVYPFSSEQISAFYVGGM